MELHDIEMDGWERVIVAREGDYHAIIALHSTALGPAVGGTRLWRYASEPDALRDALLLSRGMSHKCAMANLPLGGGKSVILAPAEIADRAALMTAHGRAVESLGGRYVTAEDVGTGPSDMDLIARETRHVAGTSARSGDPSPHTARGVFRAIQGAAVHRWRSDELRGMRVAIQGCGNVGRALAGERAAAGASLVLADLDPARAEETRAAHGGEVLAADAIWDAEVDIVAPCALGAVLHAGTIARLRAAVVCGGANNQLATPQDGERLAARGILYVPDFVANAGGVITGSGELAGYPPEWAAARVEAIRETVSEVLSRAESAGELPHQAAERIAEQRIAAAGA